MYHTFIPTLALISSVAAHGHISGILADGKYYMGYTPNIQYMNPVPKLPAWSAGGYGNEGIEGSALNQPSIACHKDAKPGKSLAPIRAGSSLEAQWTDWPESHHGPVLDYLAACDDEACATADAATLKFTKIQERGLLRPGDQNGFRFASDELRDSNTTWTVRIPAALKAGSYVLRTEIIALHQAGQPGGAQNYPQCFNLKVTGDGTKSLPKGVTAEKFYQEDEPGIVFNLYQGNIDEYPIPGPKLWDEARG